MTNSPKAPSKSPARLIVIALAGALAAAVVAIAVFPRPFLEFTAVAILNTRGLGPAQLRIDAISGSGVDLRDISVFGGAVRTSRVALGFDLAELRAGHIDLVTVEGLDATLDWDADGLRIGDFRLRSTSSDGGSAAQPPSPPAEAADAGPPVARIVIKDARAQIRLPDRDVALRTEADLAAVDGGWRGSIIAYASGQGVTLDASWGGLAAGPDLARWRGDGNVALGFEGFSIPGVIDAVTGNGTIDLTARDQGLTIAGSFPLPLAVSITQEQSVTLSRLIPSLAGTPEIAFALSGSTQPEFKIALDKTAAKPRWQIDTKATARIGKARAAATVLGWADAPDGDQSAQDFSFDTLSVAISDLDFGGGSASGEIALRDSRGPLVLAGGKFELQADASHVGLPGLSLSSAELSGLGEWRLDGLSLSFDFGALSARAENVAVPETFNLGPVISVGLAPGTQSQQLNVVFGNAVTVASQLTLGIAPFEVIGPALAAPLGVELPTLSVEGYATPADGGYQVAVKQTGGTLTYGDGVEVKPDTDVIIGDRTTTGTISALIGLKSNARPKGPFESTAEAKFQVISRIDASEDGLKITGDISGGNSARLGQFDARLKGGALQDIAFDIPRIKFGIGGANWRDVAGSLLPIDRVEGAISASARLEAAQAGFAGSGRIEFDNVDFDLDTIPVQGLDGTIAFTQGWPLKSAGIQTLRIGTIAITPPLTNVKADFEMPGDNTMLSSISAEYAGGSVDGGPAPIDLTGQPSSMDLRIADAKVDALLAATDTEGLAGAGTIGGVVPLEIRDGGLFIVDGKLEGRAGTIAYRPSVAPAALASGGEIVLQALTDFRFDDLTATINGNVLKDLNVAVALKGKNPGLYGGYPIEFNLNLDGPLARIASDGMAGYRIPDDIKRKLEQNAVSGK